MRVVRACCVLPFACITTLLAAWLSCCPARLVSLCSLLRGLPRRVWNLNLRSTKRPTRRPSCRRALRSMGNRKPCKLTPRTTRRRTRGRRRSCSATNGWLQYSSSPWSLQFLPWSSSLWYSLRPASCGQSRLTVELRCVSLSKTLAQLLSAPHIHQLIPTDVG